MLPQSPAHTCEILYNAVYTLASGDGPLIERLQDAYPGNLDQLQRASLPWPDIDERSSAVMKLYLPDDATRRIALLGLPDEKLGELAKEIFSLFVEVSRRVAAKF